MDKSSKNNCTGAGLIYLDINVQGDINHDYETNEHLFEFKSVEEYCAKLSICVRSILLFRFGEQGHERRIFEFELLRVLCAGICVPS